MVEIHFHIERMSEEAIVQTVYCPKVCKRELDDRPLVVEHRNIQYSRK